MLLSFGLSLKKYKIQKLSPLYLAADHAALADVGDLAVDADGGFGGTPVLPPTRDASQTLAAVGGVLSLDIRCMLIMEL